MTILTMATADMRTYLKCCGSDRHGFASFIFFCSSALYPYSASRLESTSLPGSMSTSCQPTMYTSEKGAQKPTYPFGRPSWATLVLFGC